MFLVATESLFKCQISQQKHFVIQILKLHFDQAFVVLETLCIKMKTFKLGEVCRNKNTIPFNRPVPPNL